MKNFLKVLGVIALFAVIGFTMTACDNGTDTTAGPQTVTYRGTDDDGSEYTLEITEGSYKLTVTPTSGQPKISSGTVTKSGDEFTLTPSGADPEDAFTVEINASGGIESMSGTITFTDGETQEAPEEITPPVAVSWTGLTANGEANSITTWELTLTFDSDPTTLAIGDITVTGATKGTLSGSGTTRTLAISNVTVAEGRNVTVKISNPAGYTITPSSKSVAIHKGGGSGGPVGPPAMPSGIFTVTGIPSQYNGMYAIFEEVGASSSSGDGEPVESDHVGLGGFQSVNMSTGVFTLVQIVNGSVSLPMWTGNFDTQQVVRYYGFDTVAGVLYIANSATPNMETTQPLAIRFWESITFSNGSATKTWASGIDFGDIPDGPGGPSAGTFTVTGIPSEYNGKYAFFAGGGLNDEALVAGCQSLIVEQQAYICVQITNGSVSLPMWSIDVYTEQFGRYSGNDIVEGGLYITNSATAAEIDDIENGCYWESITFSNGNATETWGNADSYYLDDDW